MLILLYDLLDQKLYYIYFGAIFYIISKLIHNLRLYLYTKDVALDGILCKVFYKNKKYCETEDLAWALQHTEMYEQYFKNNYTVSYYLEVKEQILRRQNNISKFVFIGLLLTYAWFIYLPIILIIIFPVVSLILAKYLNQLKDSIFNILFNLISILGSIILIYIYLKHKVIIFMTDNLWDYGIIITQKFSTIVSRLYGSTMYGCFYTITYRIYQIILCHLAAIPILNFLLSHYIYFVFTLHARFHTKLLLKCKYKQTKYNYRRGRDKAKIKAMEKIANNNER